MPDKNTLANIHYCVATHKKPNRRKLFPVSCLYPNYLVLKILAIKIISIEFSNNNYVSLFFHLYNPTPYKLSDQKY